MTRRRTRTTMPDGLALTQESVDTEGAWRLFLAVALSPSFPVGAFAYSHGVESAVDQGDVRDLATLVDWLGDLTRFGSLRNDLVLVACAFRAVQRGDAAALAEINALSLALSPTRERHLETTTQGGAFLTAARAAWPCAALALAPAGDIAYPAAVAVAAAGQGATLMATLDAFALAFVANLVSAAVRLGVLGQTDGQRALAALTPCLREAARAATHARIDDLGGAAMRADVASMRHETLYSRLFRS